MKITLSLKETETLLAWKKSSKVLLPNEEMLVAILKKHAGGGIELSDNQIVILSAWAESAVDGNFGSGAIANIEEKKIYDKIREAYTAISSDGNEIENLNTVKIPIPQKGKSLSGNSRFTKVVVIGLMLFVVILVVSRSLTHSCGEKCIHGKTDHGTHDWKVEYIAGDVSVKTAESWRPLKIGASVGSVDSIKTGLASQVVLYNGEKRVTVPENTVTIVK